jgi:hypothetical protein
MELEDPSHFSCQAVLADSLAPSVAALINLL